VPGGVYSSVTAWTHQTTPARGTSGLLRWRLDGRPHRDPDSLRTFCLLLGCDSVFGAVLHRAHVAYFVAAELLVGLVLPRNGKVHGASQTLDIADQLSERRLDRRQLLVLRHLQREHNRVVRLGRRERVVVPGRGAVLRTFRLPVRV